MNVKNAPDGPVALPVKQFKRGPYVISHEVWTSDVGTTVMKVARTPDGHYIGTTRFAHHLWKRFGIESFEIRTGTSKVCSIGYSPRRKLWFGWSHRAIHGYKTRKQAAKFAESMA